MTLPHADDPAVLAGVAKVRELVAADGGDVVLDTIDHTGVTLRLVLDTIECRECVMPRTFLEQVAADVMGTELPDIAGVRIIDPRED